MGIHNRENVDKIISPTQGYDPKLCLHERSFFFLDSCNLWVPTSLDGPIAFKALYLTYINYNLILIL